MLCDLPLHPENMALPRLILGMILEDKGWEEEFADKEMAAGGSW